MEKLLVLKNEISEINKLAIFIEELGEELNLAPDLPQRILQEAKTTIKCTQKTEFLSLTQTTQEEFLAVFPTETR